MTTPVGIGVLEEGYAELYKFPEHADCKIICGPHTSDVHKLVVISQSKYFKTALKSGAFKEGETGIVELKAVQNDNDMDETCDDPEIVKLMIEYFYLFDYGKQLMVIFENMADGGSSLLAPNLTSTLVEHARVFALAIKYQAEGLRELSTVKFKAAIDKYWDHQDLPTAISVVFNSTADDVLELRQVVEDVFLDHFEDSK